MSLSKGFLVHCGKSLEKPGNSTMRKIRERLVKVMWKKNVDKVWVRCTVIAEIFANSIIRSLFRCCVGALYVGKVCMGMLGEYWRGPASGPACSFAQARGGCLQSRGVLCVTAYPLIAPRSALIGQKPVLEPSLINCLISIFWN